VIDTSDGTGDAVVRKLGLLDTAKAAWKRADQVQRAA
jgi:hypothetical protein